MFLKKSKIKKRVLPYKAFISSSGTMCGGGMGSVVLGGIDGTAGGDVIVVAIFCGGEGDEDWSGGMGA